jgi:hypothetical protein
MTTRGLLSALVSRALAGSCLTGHRVFGLALLELASLGSSSCATGGPGGRGRPALEVGVQAVAALSTDYETRGGGVGAAVEVTLPMLELSSLRSQLLGRIRAGALVGGGVAWLLDAGGAYRLEGFSHWQPDVGLSLGLLAGDLVRTIDTAGELSGNPIALQLGLSPLRFSVSRGWVSGLGVKLGPNLFRDGAPPLSVSVTLFEVGCRY